jgi:hypothetical protein
VTTVVAPNRYELVKQLFPRDGIVVEVGVQHGRFLETIDGACEPRALFGVDVWRWIAGEYERDPANRPDAAREAEYREAAERIGKRPHVALLRMESLDACRLFADGSLDAAYLDADHTKAGFTRDLDMWWPKIRAGGILSGHDYCEREWIAVKTVLDDFVRNFGLGLMISGEPDWPSWAVRRP